MGGCGRDAEADWQPGFPGATAARSTRSSQPQVHCAPAANGPTRQVALLDEVVPGEHSGDAYDDRAVDL